MPAGADLFLFIEETTEPGGFPPLDILRSSSLPRGCPAYATCRHSSWPKGRFLESAAGERFGQTWLRPHGCGRSTRADVHESSGHYQTRLCAAPRKSRECSGIYESLYAGKESQEK